MSCSSQHGKNWENSDLSKWILGTFQTPPTQRERERETESEREWERERERERERKRKRARQNLNFYNTKTYSQYTPTTLLYKKPQIRKKINHKVKINSPSKREHRASLQLQIHSKVLIIKKINQNSWFHQVRKHSYCSDLHSVLFSFSYLYKWPVLLGLEHLFFLTYLNPKIKNNMCLL